MAIKNKKTTIFISLMLALISIFSVCVPVFAQEAQYDYSDKTNASGGIFDSADMLEEIGTSLSSAEREFLKTYSTIALKYNSVINASEISLERVDGKLNVIANEYSYIADNGKRFAWTPDTVNGGGEVAVFEKSGDAYVAVLGNGEIDEVEVFYKAETEISADDINEIINLYFYTAKYAFELEDYARKNEAYEKYVYEKHLYDDKLAVYQKYLSDYQEYLDTKYIYENYDLLINQYEKDLADYNIYLEKLQTMDADIKKYEEYRDKLKKIRHQLFAFELVFVRMKDDRDIYSAVTGGTVDQVLGSVSAIIAELGKEWDDLVKTAEDATKTLRALMIGYKSVETEEAKYSYYAANYSQMCESVFELAWSLDKLYYAPGVRAGMKALEKHEKYIILVSQLVLTANALIDGEVVASDGTKYNSSWQIDKRTYMDVLENVNYFEDNDTSAPLVNGYPAPVAKPEIEEKEKPSLPKKPESIPIAPEVVADPGEAPEFVGSPIVPTAQSESVSSVFAALDSAVKEKIAKSYNLGEIKLKDEVETSETIMLQTKVCKKYSSDEVTLKFEFYNKDGSLIEYSLITDKNTPVCYDGKTPENYTDTECSFAFDHWVVKESGERADLSAGFDRDTVFIAKYKDVTNFYSVTWNYGNDSVTQLYPEGKVPNPNFIPTIADEGDFCFEFAGWDREIEILTEDTSYTAVFDKAYIVPIDNGGALITVSGDMLICDASVSLGGKIDASKLIAKAAGKYSVRIITKVGVLDFTFTEVANLAVYGVRYIEMLFNSDGVNRSDFAFKLYGADGEISDKNLSASVKAYHSLSDLSDTVLKSGEDYCKFTKEGDYVCYSAYASVPYTLIKEYSIYVVKNDLVTISADKNVASPGEAVRFEIIKKIGIEIVSILVTDRNGEAIDFDAKNNAVVVTDSDIVISVTAKYTEYDIVFLANGVVVSHQKLTYGEMPKLPSNPVKPADGEYSYVFSGWSPEVDEVTQSIVYEARFEKISLDSGDDSEDEPKTFFGRFFKSIKDFFSNLSTKFSLFLKNIF